MQWECMISDEEGMLGLGKQIAKAVPKHALVYLYGELGAGKSTLVRGIIKSLGHQGRVKSPTYTLIEPYKVAGREIVHMDLYRLAEPQELEFLGIREYLSGQALCLIEWPDKAAGLLPTPDLHIEIHYKGVGRQVEITPQSDAGVEIINKLSC